MTTTGLWLDIETVERIVSEPDRGRLSGWRPVRVGTFCAVSVTKVER